MTQAKLRSTGLGPLPLVLCALALTTKLLLPAVVAAGDEEPFPYELDTGREIGLVGAGAALLAVGLVVSANQDALTPAQIAELDREDVNGFDRSSTWRWSPAAATASNILVGLTLMAPLSLAVTEPGSQRAGTVLTMYGETLLLNGGIVTMLKGLVNRTRPYAYNDDPDISMEQRTSHDTVLSFPSGHTANAFAAAVFMSTVYGRLHPDGSGRAWVWAGSLTAAAGVGYLRYAAGKHYPTDIIAGAVIGSLVGWLVPKLHEQDITAPGDPATKGFSLSYGFRF